jgi:methionyl aminopeptidase
MGIIIKSSQEIVTMRRAGRVVAEVIEELTKQIRPGMRTEELDAIAAREMAKRGAISSSKGYGGFPANICVSVNNEVVHGIPGERALSSGDIVSLDVAAMLDGFHGDAAVTVGIGEIDSEAKKLLMVTKEALMAGIAAAHHKARLGDISAAIQHHVELYGFSVVREYSGHGIGREMHEDPQIPNFGFAGRGPVLHEGMTLAIEPMVNMGDWRTKVENDGWTVITADGSLSAHFEHTIAITQKEPEVLTTLS